MILLPYLAMNRANIADSLAKYSRTSNAQKQAPEALASLTSGSVCHKGYIDMHEKITEADLNDLCTNFINTINRDVLGKKTDSFDILHIAFDAIDLESKYN